MSFTLRIPDELATRLAEVAEARHEAPEQVALAAIQAQLQAPRRLSFSGVGASGSSGGDIARRHREILADSLASKSARDI